MSIFRIARIVLIALGLSLFTLATAKAADSRIPAWVLQAKPPAVVFVDPKDHTTQKIELAVPKVRSGVYSKLSGEVYVIDCLYTTDAFGGCKASNLTVVDLGGRKAAPSLPLGGVAKQMTISADGSRLVFLVISKDGKHPLTIISFDPITDRFTEVYRLPLTRPDGPPVTEAVLSVTDDGKRVIVIGFDIRYQHPTLYFLGLDGGQPLAQESLGSLRIVGRGFSSDDKMLYIFGDEKDHPDMGTVRVFDVEKGKFLPSLTTAGKPVTLERITSGGLWAISENEMRFFFDAGELSKQIIPLNAQENSPGGGLPGYPGSGVELESGKIALTVVNKKGEETSHVALIDLVNGRIDRVIPTGRSGVRAEKKAGRIFKNLALASRGVVFLPGHSSSAQIVKSMDGKRLFVLNTESNDVTVIQLADGGSAPPVYMPVDSSVTHLWMAKGSSYLFCIGTKKIQVIDTNGAGGEPESFALDSNWADPEFSVDDDSATLTLLVPKGDAMVWDGRTGKLIGGRP